MDNVTRSGTQTFDPNNPQRTLPARNLYRRELPELVEIVPEIHRACHNGHVSLARTILKLDLAAVNTLDPARQTPLHYAFARPDNTEILDLLLARGANPNAKDLTGSTSLHNAVRLGDQQMLELLVKPRSTSVPVELNAQDSQGNSALHIAVQLKETSSVEVLLSHGADTSLLNTDLKKPVQIAKAQNSHSILNLLLKSVNQHR